MVRWRDWPPSYDSWCERPWFSKEQGGPIAIEAWEARQRSIPVSAAKDRAVRHRNKRSSVLDAAPAPAVAPAVVHAPAPIVVHDRPQRERRAKVPFDPSDRRGS